MAYPNPTNDHSQIVMNVNDAKIFFQVFDVNGKVIIQKTIKQIIIGQSIPLKSSPFPSGINIIKIDGKAHDETLQLIRN